MTENLDSSLLLSKCSTFFRIQGVFLIAEFPMHAVCRFVCITKEREWGYFIKSISTTTLLVGGVFKDFFWNFSPRNLGEMIQFDYCNIFSKWVVKKPTKTRIAERLPATTRAKATWYKQTSDSRLRSSADAAQSRNMQGGLEPDTWRIIPVSKWLVSPIYKPFSPFGRGISLLRGLTNHGY